MPRETVPSSGGYEVQVGWSRDREVQVGVVEPDGRSLFWTLTGTTSDVEQDARSRRLAGIGTLVRHAVYDTPHGATRDGNVEADAALAMKVLDALDTITRPCAESVWSDLNRHGINELIRLLRKARDSAYGRDE